MQEEERTDNVNCEKCIKSEENNLGLYISRIHIRFSYSMEK